MNTLDFKEFPKTFGIYKITNNQTNLSYIGSAVNLKLRLQRHYYELINNVHCNVHLQKSFDKYGTTAFEVEILEQFDSIDRNELLKLEEKYIISLDVINNGYNQMLNNSTHITAWNKSRKSIEDNKKRTSKPVFVFNRFTGELQYEFDSVSDAARFIKSSSTNVSQCCLGHKKNFLQDFTFCYQKDYDANKSYIYDKWWANGTPLTLEHKRKISEFNIKRLGKKVYQYDKDYNLINTYRSRGEAERENGIIKEGIRSWMDKEILKYGFYWKHKEIIK